jgi:hypothetical protein
MNNSRMASIKLLAYSHLSSFGFEMLFQLLQMPATDSSFVRSYLGASSHIGPLTPVLAVIPADLI